LSRVGQRSAKPLDVRVPGPELGFDGSDLGTAAFDSWAVSR
jgi:hypothetical protein